MTTQNDLQYHDCGSDGWAEYDARGIYLNRVCDKCKDAKLARYRPEVLTDSNYWCDEPIGWEFGDACGLGCDEPIEPID